MRTNKKKQSLPLLRLEDKNPNIKGPGNIDQRTVITDEMETSPRTTKQNLKLFRKFQKIILR